ncbi:hypothetical protein niasHS_013644 [Heterodera schachtii]|uniref:TIL domain-containing protein n=1 Tax=Heterodera schachtii TaxID=97005 RepID=A0ABD2IN46_HETSC
MFILICLFLLLISPIIPAQSSKCQCPENEEPGQLSCNGCEPSCGHENPKYCTLKFCYCSCDCVKGYLRNKQRKCVPKELCQHKKNWKWGMMEK